MARFRMRINKAGKFEMNLAKGRFRGEAKQGGTWPTFWSPTAGGGVQFWPAPSDPCEIHFERGQWFLVVDIEATPEEIEEARHKEGIEVLV
jgi:hypothetical protein